MIQQDIKLPRLKKEDTGDRQKCRRRIHEADPWEILIHVWRRYIISCTIFGNDVYPNQRSYCRLS